MAKADRDTKMVVKTVEVPETSVKLRLSRPEALAVRLILERIGGSSETTARGHVIQITAALDKVGVMGLTGRGPGGSYTPESYKEGAKLVWENEGELHFSTESLAIVEERTM